MAQEWHQYKIQLTRLAKILDTRIAEADLFSLSVGQQGNVSVGSEPDPQTCGVNVGTQPRIRVHMNKNSVTRERNCRRFGIHVTGRVRIAF